MRNEPRELSDRDSRAHARRIRDFQWDFMDRLHREGTVHVCAWNKTGRKEEPNELLLCLITGNELMDWIGAHRDWFEIGPQDRQRRTNPVGLTTAGRDALLNRELYDAEPVRGGLIEPGWVTIPLPMLDRDGAGHDRTDELA